MGSDQNTLGIGVVVIPTVQIQSCYTKDVKMWGISRDLTKLDIFIGDG